VDKLFHTRCPSAGKLLSPRLLWVRRIVSVDGLGDKNRIGGPVPSLNPHFIYWNEDVFGCGRESSLMVEKSI